jgi:hypothetical protein
MSSGVYEVAFSEEQPAERTVQAIVARRAKVAFDFSIMVLS